jgi:lysophospholipase L1-like esterase
MTKSPKRWQLLLMRLGFDLLAPLLLLAILEFFLRLVTTGHIYLFEENPHVLGADGMEHLRPNFHTWWYGCRYDTNAQGFRMNQDVGPKKGLRILGLGDSITLGMGVRDAENVWPNKLQSLIRAKGYGNVDVINTGVQGWNLLVNESGKLRPAEFTKFIKTDGPKLQPDIVIYCICLNDVPSRAEDLFVIDNAANKARFKLFPEKAREWVKRKAIYRLMRDGLREIRFKRLDFSLIPTPPTDDSFWEAVTVELGNLNGAVKSIGARLCCIIVPYSFQLLPANKDLNRINEKWHESLRKCDIPFIDVTSEFNENNVLDYFALGDYIHLNAKGHALIAQHALQLISPDLEAGGKADTSR